MLYVCVKMDTMGNWMNGLNIDARAASSSSSNNEIDDDVTIWMFDLVIG